MALPKIDVPIHRKYLMGIGKTVRFRAYKNKEQKILLEAKESGDDEKQRQAIMQVMQLCLLDDDINIEDMPVFDFIALFIAMRAASVNDVANVNYRYNWVDDDGKEQESTLSIFIDLNKVGVVTDEEVNDTIKISDTVFMKLKYPSIGVIMNNPSDDAIIKNSIEYLYDDEQVYDVFDDSELDEFIDNLDVKTLLEIDKFINSAPRVEHVEHVVLDDGTETDIVFNTVSDFFL